jgi:hypothetical protein
MVGLIRKLFWVALFLVATFCFIVLFEHGTQNFRENAKTEFETLKKMVGSKPERAADPSEAVAR